MQNTECRKTGVFVILHSLGGVSLSSHTACLVLLARAAGARVVAAQGAVGGAWFGTIAGLFAGLPLVGAALGAAAGGMYARLRDFGIADAEMKAFGRSLEGERAALFLLVRDCHRMRALHEVARFPARLERSSADPELVETVRRRLAVDPWDG